MRAGFFLLMGSVIAAGVATLGWGTEGFRVVTSEGAHRLAVERAPRAVPDVRLVDQDGVGFSLGDYRGEVVLVEFIYTSCPSLCGILGDDFRGVQDVIRRERAGAKVALLSISFDTARDRPAELKDYGERFGAEAPGWRVAVASPAGVASLLRTFGVVVIPDGFGGFVHNGAIYVVDRQGRLVRVIDPDASPRLFEQALGSIS